jgi:thioredoxin-related protein
MKKLFAPIFLLTFIVVAASFTLKNNDPKPRVNADAITWYSWQQAIELNKTAPRKLLVDVYTDWCGWCKVMDKQTFPNDTIAEYLNKNFYCVKLNAEMRDSITFAGNTFIWISPEKGGGRNGIHTLAYSLLDGQMSYPTIVYLSEKMERIVISPGYKKPEQLLPELKFTGEEIYKTKSWNDYMKDGK